MWRLWRRDQQGGKRGAEVAELRAKIDEIDQLTVERDFPDGLTIGPVRGFCDDQSRPCRSVAGPPSTLRGLAHSGIFRTRASPGAEETVLMQADRRPQYDAAFRGPS
jgi:hypothetical protein